MKTQNVVVKGEHGLHLRVASKVSNDEREFHTHQETQPVYLAFCSPVFV